MSYHLTRTRTLRSRIHLPHCLPITPNPSGSCLTIIPHRYRLPIWSSCAYFGSKLERNSQAQNLSKSLTVWQSQDSLYEVREYQHHHPHHDVSVHQSVYGRPFRVYPCQPSAACWLDDSVFGWVRLQSVADIIYSFFTDCGSSWVWRDVWGWNWKFEMV